MEVIGITAQYFKTSGKWYMEEEIEVPKGLSFYEVRQWIEENRPYKNEFIMAITDEFSTDIIGYPMLDFPE